MSEPLRPPPTRPGPRSRPPPRDRREPVIDGLPTATTPRSASAAPCSQRASASLSRSRGRGSSTRPCSSWTRRPATSTSPPDPRHRGDAAAVSGRYDHRDRPPAVYLGRGRPGRGDRGRPGGGDRPSRGAAGGHGQRRLRPPGAVGWPGLPDLPTAANSAAGEAEVYLRAPGTDPVRCRSCRGCAHAAPQRAWTYSSSTVAAWRRSGPSSRRNR